MSESFSDIIFIVLHGTCLKGGLGREIERERCFPRTFWHITEAKVRLLKKSRGQRQE